jgi:ketosteroid isomerase-like protein
MRSTYEIVKAHYDASARGDLGGMIADVSSECRWTEMSGFPCAGTFVGPEAIVENVFKALGAQFDNFAFALERLLDAGTEAIGVGTYTGTHKKTGRSFKARVVHVWTAQEGKIIAFEQFTDTFRVVEAMH